MESIFLPAVDTYGHSYQPENLKKLILSETSIYDVLHAFFYHSNMQVRIAALEVYVRRAYISYDLNSVIHKTLKGSRDCFVFFQFLLPTSHPNRIPHNKIWSSVEYPDGVPNSYDLSHGLDNCQRMGIMGAFESFEQFESYFLELIGYFAPSEKCPLDNDQFSFSMGSTFSDLSYRESSEKEPIHIMNIGLRMTADLNDYEASEMFASFCQAHREDFKNTGIRRVTFIIFYKRQFPRYFTYR
ncbi:hypothetical protein HAZT_HAZT011828 [Hyalella azteca]|nr:hypothetical protein HAZT_HAZT011828 [Hyalella azteca]